MHTFSPGQKFKLTNPDYYVISEEWVVVAVVYPVITFSCTKHNAVDIAYVHYSSTEEVVGSVIAEDDTEVILAFSKYSGMEVGLSIREDRATYLRSLNPLKNA